MVHGQERAADRVGGGCALRKRQRAGAVPCLAPCCLLPCACTMAPPIDARACLRPPACRACRGVPEPQSVGPVWLTMSHERDPHAVAAKAQDAAARAAALNADAGNAQVMIIIMSCAHS